MLLRIAGVVTSPCGLDPLSRSSYRFSFVFCLSRNWKPRSVEHLRRECLFKFQSAAATAKQDKRDLKELKQMPTAMTMVSAEGRAAGSGSAEKGFTFQVRKRSQSIWFHSGHACVGLAFLWRFTVFCAISRSPPVRIRICMACLVSATKQTSACDLHDRKISGVAHPNMTIFIVFPII